MDQLSGSYARRAQMFTISRGQYARDHKAILKLARLSPYTKGFQDVRFIQEYYHQGWIGIAENEQGDMVGFICIRHCVKQPWTTIYYVGSIAKGAGGQLVEWAWETSPHSVLRCGVDEGNEGGRAFWHAMGFDPLGLDTFNKENNRIIQLVYRIKKEDK
jgi:hypothetical protein